MQFFKRTTTTSTFLRNLLTPSSSIMTRAPVIAVCHGGGPMPALGDPGHKELIKAMSQKIPKILRLGTAEAPRAIVVVTAHWSERQPTVSIGESPELLYDYGGMPSEAYKLRYDAPGSPEVAKEVYDELEKAGLKPATDGKRGWDHGTFIPMMVINPKADIPVIQLSLLTSASPAQHFAMGVALGNLRESGVAIIGSGMPTLHNLRLMFSGKMYDPQVMARLREWSDRLTSTIQREDPVERAEKLECWRDWTGAKDAHPPNGVEHFLPLIVCAGAGGKGKGEVISHAIMGSEQYSYYWN